MSDHKLIYIDGECFYFRELEKIWPKRNGLNISIRDIELDAAEKNGWSGIIPWYDGEYMIIKKEDFWMGDKNNPLIRSKVNQGETYRLVDFLWLPEGKVSDLLKKASF